MDQKVSIDRIESVTEIAGTFGNQFTFQQLDWEAIDF